MPIEALVVKPAATELKISAVFDINEGMTVKVTQSPVPKVDKLKPWSEDDELAFQMGNMHGEAFTSTENSG